MQLDDILLNKTDSLFRCIKRIKEEYTGFEEFSKNITKQDAIVLNIQRACQIAIDIGVHIIRKNQLGVPKTSREIFLILEKEKIISACTSKNMQRMVGFRNIAIHDYQNLNLNIIENIIEKHLKDFEVFLEEIKRIK